jgi:hypothetical protein
MNNKKRFNDNTGCSQPIYIIITLGTTLNNYQKKRETVKKNSFSQDLSINKTSSHPLSS